MTLSAMLSDLYRRLGFASTPATSVTTRLTALLNEVQQDILGEPGLMAWIARHEPPVTIASVSGVAVYGVRLLRIDAVADRTNQRRLFARSLDWYRAAYPNPTVLTGQPDTWVPLGTIAVAQQPTAATGLWAASSSASDTAPTIALVTTRSGYLPSVEAAVTLTGTTRVAINSLTDHVEIVSCVLSAACAGAVSVYDASSGGNTLLTIPIGETASRYVGFALAPTPASATTYTIDGERPLRDLVNTDDEPPWPQAFHRILVDGTLAREYRGSDDNRASYYDQRYLKTLSQLRYAVTCPPDLLPVSGGGRPQELSRFGAWFGNTPRN